MLSGGCRTIMHGPCQKIRVDSVPERAIVTIDGHVHGKTPSEVTLPRIISHQLKIELDGYQTQNITLASNYSYPDGILFLQKHPSNILLMLIPVNTIDFAVDHLSTSAWHLSAKDSKDVVSEMSQVDFDPGIAKIQVRLKKSVRVSRKN